MEREKKKNATRKFMTENRILRRKKEKKERKKERKYPNCSTEKSSDKFNRDVREN